MSDAKPASNTLFTKPLIYQRPYSGKVKRDLSYGASDQSLDIYYPEVPESGACTNPVPAVILVTGYPDPGFEKMTGLKLKQIEQNQSWCRQLAAIGLAAIAYTAADPVKDVLCVADWLQAQSGNLAIDSSRLGVLSLSGNVPNALHLLQSRKMFRCAALGYGFMLDDETEKEVSAAAAQFRFVNPITAKVDLGEELGLLVLRMGQEQFPGLNNSIDRFVRQALQMNQDLELVNYPQGVHAFDIHDGSVRAQNLVRHVLAFYQERLLTP